MIIDQEFLKQVAIRKKYTFISTGMATVEIIEDAVKIFKKYDCPFELMHCISTYPMDTKEARLSTIAFLKKFSCKVGYRGMNLVWRCLLLLSNIISLHWKDI